MSNMKPVQVSAALRRIASKIEYSKSPNKSAVISDLKMVLASIVDLDGLPDIPEEILKVINLVERAYDEAGGPTPEFLLKISKLLNEEKPPKEVVAQAVEMVNEGKFGKAGPVHFGLEVLEYYAKHGR